jgi:cytochrome P450 PksS
MPSEQNLDLFSPRFKADPFPTFAHMRENAPIYSHVAPDGATIWYITRYDDVIEVLRDNDTFVKNKRSTLLPEEMRPNETPSFMHRLINENMLFSDPPDHTRLRGLVNQAFTPRRVQQMAPRIQAIADGLLDEAAQQGEMDLIADFALPLPTIPAYR